MSRAQLLRQHVQIILRAEGGVAVPSQMLRWLRQNGEEDVKHHELSEALIRLRALGIIRRKLITEAMRRRVRKQGLSTTATWMYLLN